MTKLRIWLASAFIWVGARIAPWPMNRLFKPYVDMITKFPEQLEMGRTFGVMTAPWGFGEKDIERALDLQGRAIAIMTKRRGEIYSTDEWSESQ